MSARSSIVPSAPPRPATAPRLSPEARAVRREDRRQQARQKAEEYVWSEEVPELMPEALAETTTPPSPKSPNYRGEEYDRIRELQSKLADAVRHQDAHRLGELLMAEVRPYCEHYVDDEVVERLHRWGL